MQMQKPVQQHCFLPSVAAVVKFHVYVCTHEKKGQTLSAATTAHNAKGHCNCGADAKSKLHTALDEFSRSLALLSGPGVIRTPQRNLFHRKSIAIVIRAL